MLTARGVGYRPGMSVFLDTTTGHGPGRRDRRAALPAAAAGRARWRAATPGSTSTARTGASSSRPASWRRSLAIGVIAYLAERSEANRRSVELFSGVVGVVLGALLFAGALADGGTASWPGLVGGVLCAALGWRAVGGLVERARGPPRGRRGRAADRLRRRRRAAAGRDRDLRAARLDPRPRRVRGAAARRPRGARARSTPGSGYCASPSARSRPKKLVLAVIDSLKPDMLDLAIEEGRAPTLGGAARAAAPTSATACRPSPR